jgi:hypothetical protein
MLDTAKESMHDIMRKNQEKYAQVENPELTADIVGKAAIMIQDMSAKRYLPWGKSTLLTLVYTITNSLGTECYPLKETQGFIYNTHMPDSPPLVEKTDLPQRMQWMLIFHFSLNLKHLSFFAHWQSTRKSCTHHSKFPNQVLLSRICSK